MKYIFMGLLSEDFANISELFKEKQKNVHYHRCHRHQKLVQDAKGSQR